MNLSDLGGFTEEAALKTSFPRTAIRVLTAGVPDNRTPKQVVEELKLTKDCDVLMPDGVWRTVRRVTSNFEVFVYEMRGRINVYTISAVR